MWREQQERKAFPWVSLACAAHLLPGWWDSGVLSFPGGPAALPLPTLWKQDVPGSHCPSKGQQVTTHIIRVSHETHTKCIPTSPAPQLDPQLCRLPCVTHHRELRWKVVVCVSRGGSTKCA